MCSKYSPFDLKKYVFAVSLEHLGEQSEIKWRASEKSLNSMSGYDVLSTSWLVFKPWHGCSVG